MTVVSPAEWGARLTYDARPPISTPRERIALHYNGGPIASYDKGRRFEEAALRAIEKWHIEGNGWTTGIGYGFAAGHSGTTYRLRGWSSLAAHKGDYDRDGVAENLETQAILLILGGTQTMSEPMKRSVAELRLDFEQNQGRELVLIGHQEIAQQGTGTATQCPGAGVMEYVRANRRLGSIPAGEPIMGQATTTAADAVMWASGKGSAQIFVDVIPIYYDVFPVYGVRPEVGAVQAFWETGGGRFGRAVTPGHHNWCGLKVTDPTGADDDPDSHARFPTDRHGIIAHAEHLRLYASKPTPGAIDPRHFPWLAGTAPTVRSLGGKWAPSATYGERLEQLLRELATGADLWPAGLEPHFRQSWQWAKEKGIVSDSSMPDAAVSDERLMEFLHRALT